MDLGVRCGCGWGGCRRGSLGRSVGVSAASQGSWAGSGHSWVMRDAGEGGEAEEMNT